MALEDRCSPQSAPSPPGLPSQQLSSAATILDMSLQHSPTLGGSLSQPGVVNTNNLLSHPAATLYQQQQLQHLHHLQQLQQLHQQQQQLAAAAAAGAFQQHQHVPFEAPPTCMALPQRLVTSPGAHSSTSSTPASTIITIKEEENDSVIGDGCHAHELDQRNNCLNEDEDDDDIDVDDVEETAATNSKCSPPPPPAHQQSGKPSITFSISNILSDRFGGAEQQKAPATPTSIFRPFEAVRGAAATPSAFTRVDLLEFSRQQQAAAAAAATAAMMIERANFLNCFNPVSYPRIHEEIVNSRLRRNSAVPHKQLETATGSPEKSALGSLCKTVSQIGQPQTTPTANNSTASAAACIASPPPNSCNSAASCSSASSQTSSPTSRLASKSNSPQPIPAPSAISRDSGLDSSDDTRSETGSTTTEGGKNEMWPAWVYCTRYSDRPSSVDTLCGNMWTRRKSSIQMSSKAVAHTKNFRPKMGMSMGNSATRLESRLENRRSNLFNNNDDKYMRFIACPFCCCCYICVFFSLA